jgi:hypothetical protein
MQDTLVVISVSAPLAGNNLQRERRERDGGDDELDEQSPGCCRGRW